MKMLKADLYRMSRPARMHGYLWKWVICLFILMVVMNGMLSLVPGMMSEQAPSGTISAEQLDSAAASLQIYERAPSAFFASVLISPHHGSDLAVLFAGLSVAAMLIADMRNGTLSGLGSSTRGRLAVVVERIVLAGLWKIIIFSSDGGRVRRLASGLQAPDHRGGAAGRPSAVDGVRMAVHGALAAIMLCLYQLAGSAPLCYGSDFTVASGLVPAGVLGLSQALRAALPAAGFFGAALRDLARCGRPAWRGIWGGITSRPALAGLALIALASIAMLLVASRRDMR